MRFVGYNQVRYNQVRYKRQTKLCNRTSLQRQFFNIHLKYIHSKYSSE